MCRMVAKGRNASVLVMARRSPALAFPSGRRFSSRQKPEARSKASKRRTTAAARARVFPSAHWNRARPAYPGRRGLLSRQGEVRVVAMWKRWNAGCGRAWPRPRDRNERHVHEADGRRCAVRGAPLRQRVSSRQDRPHVPIPQQYRGCRNCEHEVQNVRARSRAFPTNVAVLNAIVKPSR